MKFELDSLPPEDSVVIQHHSRSFSLAAGLLPRTVRKDVEKLYAWCRWCDEAVDEAPNQETAAIWLTGLREDVERIYRGEPPLHAASQWLAELVDRHSIPKHLPLDLLEGMETDLGNPVFETEGQLLEYAYQAAGTVGLMMCRVLGVSDPRAFPKAKALGMAMQLTNIARDVKEDWVRGRRYLPKPWLSRVPGKDLLPTNQEARNGVQKLLAKADDLYEEGLRGLADLPASVRYAIRLAGGIYREIGEEIRRNDFQVMNGRMFVNRSAKFKIAAKSLVDEFRFRLRPHFAVRPQPFSLTSPAIERNRLMAQDHWYLFYLGISLTLVMATTLFLLVGMNPKQEAYDSLPWLYAAGTACLAAATGWLARRYRDPVEADAVESH